MNVDLHYKADKLREMEKFDEALRVYDRVIEKYLENKNFAGVADALQGKVLTYKHLYARKRNEEYLKLATGCAKSSLEIINKYNIKDMYASGYFRMGEVYRLANKYKGATKNFEEAYKLTGKNKERGDYLYHLGEAVYKSGKKILGKRKIIEGMKLIKKDKSRLDGFIYNVWLSGANLRLGQIFIEEKNEKEANKYINRAKKIIDGDKKLVIRKKQLEEIRSGKYYW